MGVLPGPAFHRTQHHQEITMFEPFTSHSSTSSMEWGPAHHREDAARPEIEPIDRPDDN